MTGLRIPSGRRQTSWLFTSVVEDLNSGQPWTNPVSESRRDLNLGPPKCKSKVLTSLPRCLHVYNENKMTGCFYVWVKVTRVVTRRWKYEKSGHVKRRESTVKKSQPDAWMLGTPPPPHLFSFLCFFFYPFHRHLCWSAPREIKLKAKQWICFL